MRVNPLRLTTLWSTGEKPGATGVCDGAGSFFNFTRDLVNYDKGLKGDDKLEGIFCFQQSCASGGIATWNSLVASFEAT